MASIDDLKNLSTPAPTGFKPGIEWDGNSGHVTVLAAKGETPDKEAVNGVIDSSPFLSSDEVQVDWTARPRVSIHHDDNGQLVQAWYKLPLRRRPERSFEVEELIDLVLTPPDLPDVESPNWVTILVTDTHIGKSLKDGAGSETLVNRWRESIHKAMPDEPVEGINLCFGGDLIEGIVSQNGANIAGMDLTLSEQIRVAQHLVLETIQLAVDRAKQVVVAAVAGNHGETTRVQNMPAGDSHDIQIVNTAEQALRFAGVGEDRVRFYYPENNRFEVTYEAGGTTFCLVHGHRFKGQLNGAQKWWEGQTMNGRPAGAAGILLAGHFHNALIQNFTRDKWIMFGSALETESNWLANINGTSATPGILSFETENKRPVNIRIN